MCVVCMRGTSAAGATGTAASRARRPRRRPPTRGMMGSRRKFATNEVTHISICGLIGVCITVALVSVLFHIHFFLFSLFLILLFFCFGWGPRFQDPARSHDTTIDNFHCISWMRRAVLSCSKTTPRVPPSHSWRSSTSSSRAVPGGGAYRSLESFRAMVDCGQEAFRDIDSLDWIVPRVLANRWVCVATLVVFVSLSLHN